MARKNELTVVYRKTIYCLETQEVDSYMMEAFVPGRECTSFDFWLKPDGSMPTASRSFFDLDHDTRNQLITLGQNVIQKLTQKV